jgi:proteasome lid subunit RPN8/RPN11
MTAGTAETIVRSFRHRKNVSQVRTLVLQEDVLEDLRAQALRKHPFEACGFLCGRFDGAEARATGAIFVNNMSPWPDRLVPDSREYDQVLMHNEQLVAFFHSHAGDPQPSGLDKINMRFLPLIWLIVGWAERGSANHCMYLAFKTCHRTIQEVDVLVAGNY